MADRTFEVNITTAVQAPYAIKKAGYAGEHNATAIQINLPAEYIGGFTYSLDVTTGAGESYKYPVILGDGDDFFIFEVPHPLTDKGVLELTLKITETITQMLVKSRGINLQFIGRDINTYAELADNYVPPVDINGSASGLVIEYADLDAPYAGYPFRHTPGGKIVEQEHYVLPLDVPLKLYVNPVPPLTDLVRFDDYMRETSFHILPPEDSGVAVNIAFLTQELGLNENGEDVEAQYIYTPQEISLMGNTFQKGWNYLSLVDEEADFTTLRPISYDEVPRMLFTIGDEYADEWEPAGGTYLSETPYLSEGSLYCWNGAEYVEVGGADLSNLTVNAVAPINGNITLDTSNIESTLDRWYLTDADRYLLYALKGASTSEYYHTSFVVSGTNNEITGTESAIVAGGYNRITGNYSAVIGGAGNLASATGSATVGGEGLIASADHSAIVGKYGETPADSRFAVANGTDENNKKIVFYVGGDGISHFDKMPVVPADRVIDADNQLVDKKYVDENAGVTVNEVAPINGNITLDTNNIEPTEDRWYLTNADTDLLSALRGDNDGAVFPRSSFILSGDTNDITGNSSAIVAGAFNSVDGWYSATIGGMYNSVPANCSATIGGAGLIASAAASAIVGRHGETPVSSLFAVANGTDENDKNIAFYVGGDGVSHFDEMPVVPADRVITEDNQLVDKKYVYENAGSTSLTELTGSVLSVGNFYKTVSENISFTLPTADTSKSNLIMLDLEVVGNISIGFGTTYAANMSVPLMVAGNYLVSWEYSNIVSDWIVTVLPYGVIV